MLYMCFSLLNEVILIIDINNNYSPKWRWLAVDIPTEADKHQGKYPPLATDTEVNNIVLVYTKTVR